MALNVERCLQAAARLVDLEVDRDLVALALPFLLGEPEFRLGGAIGQLFALEQCRRPRFFGFQQRALRDQTLCHQFTLGCDPGID